MNILCLLGLHKFSSEHTQQIKHLDTAQMEIINTCGRCKIKRIRIWNMYGKVVSTSFVTENTSEAEKE